MITNDKALRAVVGLGVTGVACVHYLMKQGYPVVALDSRENPPNVALLQTQYPELTICAGAFDEAILNQASEIILSPGVSLREPAIAKQVHQGKSVIGDIELFARVVKQPVIAITGSNGKSTVTQLVGDMLRTNNKQVAVCGNIGYSALDAQASAADNYVMELSSFQLETTYSLKSYAATILNISADHMDRYHCLQDYIQAKQRIYQHCQHPAINLDDFACWQNVQFIEKPLSFSVLSDQADYHLIKDKQCIYLAYRKKPLLPVNEMHIKGRHNWQNALAALALTHELQLSREQQLIALKQFKGLPHRCQFVRRKAGVEWINDSKATNVGAAQAAINSIGEHITGKIILLAGGQSKNADFSELRAPIRKYVSHCFVFGEDAAKINEALQNDTQLEKVKDLVQAIDLAARIANEGDVVLLAPACASFDMFNNFEHRGECFIRAVEAL